MTAIGNQGVLASSVSGEHRLHQVANISAAWCGDELVLLDATSGRYFTLNHVGGRIWEQLATPRSAEDLVQYLCTEYDIPPSTNRARLGRDVAQLLENLLDAGLIVAEMSHAPSVPTLRRS